MEPNETLKDGDLPEVQGSETSFDGVEDSAGSMLSEKAGATSQGQSTQQTIISAQTAQYATPSSTSKGIVSATVQLDVPPVADDIELIEKAWVRKAKEIVNQTTGDPYNQNKQINKVKAEYIKKRYDKDIKVSEE